MTYSAIRALPDTLLLRAPESKLKYTQLVADIGDVLQSWSKRWVGLSEWQSFLNRKSFCHEVEEAVVPIYEVIMLVEQREMVRQSAGSVVPPVLDVVDLCCGKGFFAMLLSYLAPKYPLLERHIRRIVIVEKNRDVKWDHIHACNVDVVAATTDTDTSVKGGEDAVTSVLARLHIDVWGNTNIHSEEFERRLLDIHRGSHCSVMTPTTKQHASQSATKPQPEVGLVFVGIHLCRRLSSRFVELANMFRCRESRATTAGVVLAPCCLPRFSGVVYVQTRALAGLAAASNAYAAGGTVLCGTVFPSTGVGARKWNKNMCWRCGEEGHDKTACAVPEEEARELKRQRRQTERLEQGLSGAVDGGSATSGGAPLGFALDAAAYTRLELADLAGNTAPFRAWCEFLFDSLARPDTASGIASFCGVLRVELADGVRHGVGGDVSGTARDGTVAAESSVGEPAATIKGSEASSVVAPVVDTGDKNWNDFRKTTWLIAR